MHRELDNQPPLVYRLLRTLGRPFGLRWVGDNQVAVVYRLERYHSLKGPGFFWINPFTQTMRRIISTAPEFVSIEAVGIHTEDALQLGLTVAMAYEVKPTWMPPDKAALYVTWTREARQSIVTNHATNALQDIVPSFNAEEICRGTVFRSIEDRLMSALGARLRQMALKPLICFILRVTVPPKLQDRFEAVVQRQVNIEDLSRYAPYELSQALRIEALEALRGMAGGRQYINMPDMTDMVAPSQGQLPPRRIIPGTIVKGKESEEELLPPPPPAKTTKSRL
jgi:regulator of protease activity HflC (stomatin/prohibitin superfamily)